ncbi:MAG: beta-ketoacyl synthase N-terminal-like domain-containing protein, partial [Myxococcota bacterium]|nr:beta-ketoacyl synthase N-terminal-like domain-containing protein [Myxococcota bacterium]
MAKHTTKPPIAIVGVSALVPGSSDLEGFWRDIVSGTDMIRDVPPNYWLIEDYYDPDPTVPDKTYCKRGGFLDKLDFDPVAFGIPPSLLPTTDTAQLLALVMAKRALEDVCQGDFADMDREKVSVILGVAAGLELLGEMASRLQRPIWSKAMREAGLPESEVQDLCNRITSHFADWKESTFPGLLGNVVAGRVANRFDLGGTNCS